MTGGRTLLLAGATGPLAEATIRLLAERGDRLLLVGRNTDRLAQLDRDYGSPGRVETLAADVSRPLDARRAASHAARMGHLDGLVHLVGGFHRGPVGDTGLPAYEDLMRANFLSAVSATRAVLPLVGTGARLVYVGSTLAGEPRGGFGAYAASKAALLTWVRVLADEVRPQGIHANAVMTTMADTPRARRERPFADFGGAVTPEQIARVIAFLTCPESDGLYGGVIPVLGRAGIPSPGAGGPPSGRPAPTGPPGQVGPPTGPAQRLHPPSGPAVAAANGRG